MKLPKDYHRKDWRDKAFTGYFVGYNEPGVMNYRLYVPDVRETVVGVNVTFSEVVPSYAEEYYNELNKLKFEVASDEYHQVISTSCRREISRHISRVRYNQSGGVHEAHCRVLSTCAGR